MMCSKMIGDIQEAVGHTQRHLIVRAIALAQVQVRFNFISLKYTDISPGRLCSRVYLLRLMMHLADEIHSLCADDYLLRVLYRIRQNFQGRKTFAVVHKTHHSLENFCGASGQCHYVLYTANDSRGKLSRLAKKPRKFSHLKVLPYTVSWHILKSLFRLGHRCITICMIKLDSSITLYIDVYL